MAINSKDTVKELRKHDGELARRAASVIDQLDDELRQANNEIRRLSRSREVNVVEVLEAIDKKVDELMAQADALNAKLDALLEKCASKPKATTKKAAAKETGETAEKK